MGPRRSSPAERRPISSCCIQPLAVQKPEFVEQVVVEAEAPNRSSLLLVDIRDERLISPFQNWLVDEIMSNAASSINVLTERGQVMLPSSGYHCSLFANYTLDGIQAVLVFTMSSKTGGACAQLCPTRLFSRSHGRSCSTPRPPTWMSRSSMAIGPVPLGVSGVPIGLRPIGQQQFRDEVLIHTANEGWFRPSIVISVFVGWKVSVTSFEVGAGVYTIGPRGSVVANDRAGSNYDSAWPLALQRKAMAMTPIEFRFRSSSSRCYVAQA